MPGSQHIEWKESWRDEHMRQLCGFANSAGGTLVIGRDDRGRPVGIPNADARKLREDLPNKIRDLLGIITPVNLRREAAGKTILEIAVPPYPTPINYRGHYYQRVGSTNQELKGASLDRFLLHHYGRTWDGAPLPGVTIKNLSTPAITRFRQQARRSGRLDAEALKAPKAELLTKLKLTEGQYLKRAAALLFHPDPLTYVTGAFVKVGFFQPDGELLYHDEINGALFQQSQQTQDLLLTKYLKAAITYEGIVRVERYPVPREALREAVLNALVHRDYAVPAPVQIRVYDDKLILWNPAVLPEGWTEATLLAPHTSQPYNPQIANTFFRAGEIEAWGRGIERIFTACRNAGTPKPKIRFDAGGIWTEFIFSASYLRTMKLTSAAQVTAPVAAPVTPQVTAQVTAQDTAQVAPEIVRMLAILDGDLNRKEIMNRLGLKHVNHFRDNYQQAAVAADLIEMTIPDKPNSRLQKYRLTAKGAATLATLQKKKRPTP